MIAGDDVSAAAAYGFGDKNARTNKVVTASSAALSGDDAGNYRLDPLATALADILRRDINAVVTANDKTYDATTAATGSLALDGVLTGDDLSITGDLLFADKNAGQSKVVSVANAPDRLAPTPATTTSRSGPTSPISPARRSPGPSSPTTRPMTGRPPPPARSPSTA